MKKSNLKIVIIILIIILLCVTWLCVFLIADVSNKVKQDSNGQILNKTKVKADLKVSEVKKTEPVEHDISLKNSMVSDLSNMVISVFNGPCIVENNRDTFRKSESINPSDISMYTKLSLTAQYIYNNHHEYFKYEKIKNNNTICGKSYLSEDGMKLFYQEIFGKDAIYERSSFHINGDDYNWSDENNRYEANVLCGKGGTCPGGSVSKAAYARQKGNDIYIYEYYAYIDMDQANNTYNIYSDYNRQNLILSQIISVDDLFNGYKDVVGLYKYTFKYDDQNKKRYLEKIEKVK